MKKPTAKKMISHPETFLRKPSDAPVRAPIAVRRLFVVQALPLQEGAAPGPALRPVRKKPGLWTLLAAVLLGLRTTMAADATNAPASDAPATNAQVREPAASSDSGNGRADRRSSRQRGQETAPAPAPASTNAVARTDRKQDFSEFKIIADRNIFDPNRNPRRTTTNNVPRPRPKEVDTLALVGVMTYEKGSFAFFDGSKGEFRKALKPSDSIGGLKIVEVEPNLVRLAKSGKTLELTVGAQLKREDEGEWKSGGSAESFGSTTSSHVSTSGSASPSTANPSPTSASASPSADNDVLKRMMQRREQE